MQSEVPRASPCSSFSWKNRVPKLGASCLPAEDSEEDDDRMDTAPVTTGVEMRSRREPSHDNAPDRSMVHPTQTSRRIGKPALFISEDEYCMLVDRIESVCERELWGCGLKLVDELLARRCDEKVLEMKAQILMELCRDFEAVQCCEGSTKLNPIWWEAHRTHGRALLAFGEPRLATKAFQRALRLNPADEELREELHWARRNTVGWIPTEGCDFKKLVRKRDQDQDELRACTDSVNEC